VATLMTRIGGHLGNVDSIRLRRCLCYRSFGMRQIARASSEIRQGTRCALLTAILVFALAGCRTAGEEASGLTTMSDVEFDQMEVEFAQHAPPPPQRTIEEEKEIVALFDFSHRSACDGQPFYQVFLPAPGERSTEEKWNVHIKWRDAATTAFRYGDLASALEYLKAARKSLPSTWKGHIGGLQLARAIYFSILGDQSGAQSANSAGNNKIFAGAIQRSKNFLSLKPTHVGHLFFIHFYIGGDCLGMTADH